MKLRIKDANDLVSLVEGYLPLKPRGRHFVGLCPFHQEKTPSFTVFPDTQHFKCFGCGKAGDVFTFLMEREGLGFRDALQLLADRAGISTEGVFKGGGEDRARKADVHTVLGKVCAWFQACLRGPDGGPARDYLAARGLTDAIEPWSIGWHPAHGRLGQFAREQRLPGDVLAQAGLLLHGRREPLAGRVVFPILDERGQVVGFGGRVLDKSDDGPKYLNSPDAPWFNKRRLLFGLHQVKRAGERRIVVVEGYTDVIACHMAGVAGAVATLGTALTADHARLLLRWAHDGVVLLFDGDRAGRQAAERAFRELVHVDLPVRIALLEQGDPADLVAPRPGVDPATVEAGRQALRSLIDGAEDAARTWFRLLGQRVDLTTDVGQAQAANECGQILGTVENAVRRTALLRRMAALLGVSEEALRRLVKVRPPQGHSALAAAAAAPAAAAGADRPSDPRSPPGDGEVTDAEPEATVAPALRKAELALLACLLQQPTLQGAVTVTGLLSRAARDLVVLFGEGLAQGCADREALARYSFARCTEHPTLRALLAACLERTPHVKDPQELLAMLQRDLHGNAARQEAQRTRIRLQQARMRGEHDLADRLTRVYLAQLRGEDPEERVG